MGVGKEKGRGRCEESEAWGCSGRLEDGIGREGVSVVCQISGGNVGRAPQAGVCRLLQCGVRPPLSRHSHNYYNCSFTEGLTVPPGCEADVTKVIGVVVGF